MPPLQFASLSHWPLWDLNVVLKMQSSKLALLICVFKSSYINVLRWMPQDPTDDKSTLVQVMAWSRQATSHYLSQCWPRSPTPYGVSKPQWVKHTYCVLKVCVCCCKSTIYCKHYYCHCTMQIHSSVWTVLCILRLKWRLYIPHHALRSPDVIVMSAVEYSDDSQPKVIS